ncbi:MAG: stage II sporulation protein M [Firmicutes bacterium]|nr:stage II sporulation protein M [Bacillota bacterium]
MFGRRVGMSATGVFKTHVAAYFFVGVLFVTGVAFGAVAVKGLTADQKSELVAYVDTLLRGVVRYTEPVSRAKVFQASLLNNLKTAAALWFLGVTVIGIPLVLLIVFTRGFTLGFAVAFLVEDMGYRGILFSAAAVLPQNLLAVPAILSLGVLSLSFSFILIASRRSGRGIDFLGEFSRYSLLAALLGAALLASSGVEAVVTPSLISLIGAGAH